MKSIELKGLRIVTHVSRHAPSIVGAPAYGKIRISGIPAEFTVSIDEANAIAVGYSRGVRYVLKMTLIEAHQKPPDTPAPGPGKVVS